MRFLWYLFLGTYLFAKTEIKSDIFSIDVNTLDCIFSGRVKVLGSLKNLFTLECKKVLYKKSGEIECSGDIVNGTFYIDSTNKNVDFKLKILNGLIIYNKIKIVMKGDLLFVKNNLRLKASGAEILLNENNYIDCVKFQGVVTVVKDDIIAQSKHARYLPNSKKFIMQEAVIVLKSDSFLLGDNLEIDFIKNEYIIFSNIEGVLQNYGR